jgi:DNA polymerase III alpha subunit (gram-positive type)
MSSFLTQSADEDDDSSSDLSDSLMLASPSNYGGNSQSNLYVSVLEDHQRQEDDADFEDQFLSNSFSSPHPPVLSPSSTTSSPLRNSQEMKSITSITDLTKKLTSKFDKQIHSMQQKNRTDYLINLQKTLESVQSYYEGKLAKKDQQIAELQETHQTELLEKEEEIHRFATSNEQHILKWQSYREKLVEVKYQQFIRYSSPFSLKNLFNEWKVRYSQAKELKKKEKLISKLSNSATKEKYFLLMTTQYQQNKSTSSYKELKFKYDSLSSEVSLLPLPLFLFSFPALHFLPYRLY